MSQATVATPTDETLTWHLQNNFYPPYNLRCLPFVKQAIALARQGRFDAQVVLRGDLGRTMTKTVEEMVEAFRLEDFIREE